MININVGKNEKLLLKCKILGEYSFFVECVRKHSKKYKFPTTVDRAVKECIEKGVLKDILIKHNAEVKNMLLTEFDEEKDWAIIAKGFEEIGFEKGKIDLIKTMLFNGATKETILKLTGITENDYNSILASE